MTPDELSELKQFASEIEEYEKTHHNPAREAAEDAEYAKLAAAYPGQFVAFLDNWDGNSLTRTVLAHDRNSAKVSRSLSSMTEDARCQVQMTYIDPPNEVMTTRLQTGEARTTSAPPTGA